MHIFSCDFSLSAMIDNIGGPNRVNNFLTTLNIKSIDKRSLKHMERRAGQKIEDVAQKSMAEAAAESYKMEMT